jgi:hypothetical protein
MMNRIGELIGELEQGADAETRERARELVQTILDVHRVGLEKLLELARAPVEELAREESVAILLSMHDLHPEDAASRVRAAIDAVAPRLLDEGVAVELTSVDGDRVRIALRAAGPVRAHVAGLRGELERLVRRSAPEIVAVDIDGLEASDVPAGRIGIGPPKK